jgi:hypothetical protein
MILKAKIIFVNTTLALLLGTTVNAQDAKAKVVSKADSIEAAAINTKMAFIKNKEAKEQEAKLQLEAEKEALYLKKMDSIRIAELPLRAKLKKIEAERQEAEEAKKINEEKAKQPQLSAVELKKINEQNEKRIAQEKLNAAIEAAAVAKEKKIIENERLEKEQAEKIIKAKAQKIADDKAMADEQIRYNAIVKESKAKYDSLLNDRVRKNANDELVAKEAAKKEAETLKDGKEIYNKLLNKVLVFKTINGSDQLSHIDLQVLFFADNNGTINSPEGRMAFNVYTDNGFFRLDATIAPGQEIVPAIQEQLNMLQSVLRARYYKNILSLLDANNNVLATLKEK